MPLNFKQRAIFVYLRGKDDNRSCTPAGAKLTNEYTHRTNKNDPCTVSVIPSQLCTFFRKRTFSPERRKNSSDLSFDSSEVSFDSSEEIFLSPQGNDYSPASYLGISSELSERSKWSVTSARISSGLGVIVRKKSPPGIDQVETL